MNATEIGKLAVRRSIEIDASPERVWQEFASAERFRLWYTPAGGVDMNCKRMEYEPRVGGNFETWGYHDDMEFHFGGRVLVFDSPRELTVEMKPMHYDAPAAFLLTFFLTPLDGGRTKVEIVQHAFERFGDVAENLCNSYEQGWTNLQLEVVKRLVETGRATE